MAQKLGDVIRKAVAGDIAAAKGVADFCRFRLGLNWQQTLELVQKVCPRVTAADWDALLYEVDSMESGGWL